MKNLSFRTLKELFKALQHTKLSWIVSVVATIHLSLKHRRKVLIFKNTDGRWINHQSDIRICSQSINVNTLKDITNSVLDYWCYKYLPLPGDVIVDVGAGIGDELITFSGMVGITGKVIGIEAHPSSYICAVETVNLNKLDNVFLYNFAATRSKTTVHITDNANYLSNSILEGNSYSSIPIQGFPLDECLSENQISSINLLKMNIEGAEIDALLGMPLALKMTKNIVISCHDFIADRGDGEIYRTYKTVCQILLAANFTLYDRKDDPRAAAKYYIYGKK